MNRYSTNPTLKSFLLFWSLFLSTSVFAQIGAEHNISAPLLSGPTVMHNADLDGDGIDDLIAAGSQVLVWYKNTGNDSFLNFDTISTALGVSSIYAADFDGDLDLDIVCSSNRMDCGDFELQGHVSQNATRSEDGSPSFIPPLPMPPSKSFIAWIENLGDGNFGVAQIIDDDLSFSQSVYAKDLDDDGDEDILLGTSSGNYMCAQNIGSAIWYQNDGFGGFGAKNLFSPLTDSLSVFSIRAIDLDADLDYDVVATYNKDRRVIWYENLGSGIFSDQQPLDSALAYAATELEIADMDADAEIDLLLGTYDEIYWVKNSSRQFTTRQSISSMVDNLKSVYPSDLDSDGDMDVISASSFDSKVAWYANDGSGFFGAQNVVDSVVPGANQVLSINADGNSELEILALSLNDWEIVWYKNALTLQFESERVITPEIRSPREVTSTDMDDDGDNDVVVASSSNGKVLHYENLGNGNFSDALIVGKDVLGVQSITTADLDNDGQPDIIAAAITGNKIFWYRNLGANNYAPSQVIASPAGRPLKVVASDIDGDNLNDIVATQFDDDEVVWYKNLGDGLFSSEQIIAGTLDGAFGLDVADLDSDGDNDVVVGVNINDLIVWFENLGGGNFSTQQILDPSANSNLVVLAADMDADGDKDVLSGGLSYLRWYENLGSGTFTPPVELLTANVYSLQAADLTQNNELDIVLGYSTSGSNSGKVYENDGLPSLGTPQPLGTLWGRIMFATARVDSDGDIDIVASAQDENKVSWFENLVLVTDVEQQEHNPQITVYPNPTQGVCIVRVNQPTVVKVYDAIGKLLFTKNCNVLSQLNLQDQSEGIYFLNFETSTGIESHRVVKMN